jgi:hypothetical protein
VSFYTGGESETISFESSGGDKKRLLNLFVWINKKETGFCCNLLLLLLFFLYMKYEYNAGILIRCVFG